MKEQKNNTKQNGGWQRKAPVTRRTQVADSQEFQHRKGSDDTGVAFLRDLRAQGDMITPQVGKAKWPSSHLREEKPEMNQPMTRPFRSQGGQLTGWLLALVRLLP